MEWFHGVTDLSVGWGWERQSGLFRARLDHSRDLDWIWTWSFRDEGLCALRVWICNAGSMMIKCVGGTVRRVSGFVTGCSFYQTFLFVQPACMEQIFHGGVRFVRVYISIFLNPHSNNRKSWCPAVSDSRS